MFCGEKTGVWTTPIRAPRHDKHSKHAVVETAHVALRVVELDAVVGQFAQVVVMDVDRLAARTRKRVDRVGEAGEANPLAPLYAEAFRVMRLLREDVPPES